MMTNYERKMLNALQTRIAYLMLEKRYSPYDISIMLDDFIYNNEFSNECNQKLWGIQEKYINLYRGELKC